MNILKSVPFTLIYLKELFDGVKQHFYKSLPRNSSQQKSIYKEILPIDGCPNDHIADEASWVDSLAYCSFENLQSSVFGILDKRAICRSSSQELCLCLHRLP